MFERAATPLYSIGDRVAYEDHHGRIQSGEVFRVEAKWRRRGESAFISYTVRHPTYRSNRMHIAETGILGLANGALDA